MAEIQITPRETEIVRYVLRPHAAAIDQVIVFGSRANGTAKSYSDIDLALTGRVDAALINRLWTEFDESSLAVRVDLLDLAAQKATAIARHVANVGKPLFDRTDLGA